MRSSGFPSSLRDALINMQETEKEEGASKAEAALWQ